MVQVCCVCCNTSHNNKNVSFHLFPKDISKRTMWLNALNLTSVTNCKKVCSAHFSANDFIFSFNRNLLQKNAVPTRYSKLMEEHSYAANVSISSPCLMISDVYDRSPSTSRTKSYENLNVVDVYDSSPSTSTAKSYENLNVVDVYDSSPSTSTAKSYENLNVVKTSRPPLFNLCTDVEVITPPRKKRIRNPSRLGDLSDEDFSTPKRRKKNLCLIRKTDKNIRRKNKVLSQRNKRLEKKVSSLLDIINELKNKLLISEHAAINL